MTWYVKQDSLTLKEIWSLDSVVLQTADARFSRHGGVVTCHTKKLLFKVGHMPPHQALFLFPSLHSSPYFRVTFVNSVEAWSTPLGFFSIQCQVGSHGVAVWPAKHKTWLTDLCISGLWYYVSTASCFNDVTRKSLWYIRSSSQLWVHFELVALKNDANRKLLKVTTEESKTTEKILCLYCFIWHAVLCTHYFVYLIQKYKSYLCLTIVQ